LRHATSDPMMIERFQCVIGTVGDRDHTCQGSTVGDVSTDR
jgi:hypothetical protein